MTSAGTGRSGHSALGIASSILSFLPVVLLVGAFGLVLYLTRNDPPGADQTGYGFAMLMLVLLTTLSEIGALGLGIAGAIQRRRRRTFALVGVACSILVLAAIHAQVGLDRLAFGIPELVNPPEVHSVSPPGNE